MQYLAGIGEAWGLLPREHAVVFVDNHDTQRGGAELTYKSGALYTLANIFMLAHPYGFPKVCPSDDPTALMVTKQRDSESEPWHSQR